MRIGICLLPATRATAMLAVASMLCGSASAQQNQPVECLPDALSKAATLRDQADRPLAASQFTGRLTLVTFVSGTCDATCAMRMVDLDRIARGLPLSSRDRLSLVAIDTGARSHAEIRQFATRWRLSPIRWTLLRGPAATIAALRRRIDVAPATAVEPSALVAVFDAGGTLRQRYSGAPLDRDRVAGEIATLATLPPLVCSASSAIRS